MPTLTEACIAAGLAADGDGLLKLVRRRERARLAALKRMTPRRWFPTGPIPEPATVPERQSLACAYIATWEAKNNLRATEVQFAPSQD